MHNHQEPSDQGVGANWQRGREGGVSGSEAGGRMGLNKAGGLLECQLFLRFLG